MNKYKIRKVVNRGLSFVLAMAMVTGTFVGNGISGVTVEAATHDTSHPSTTEQSFSYTSEGETASGKITKSAKWTDIENGLAEITITEEDTGNSKDSLAGADYCFVLDSSHSMDFVMAGVSSFCIYPTHCYLLNGKWCKLYDHGNGTLVVYINSPTNQTSTGSELISFVDDPTTEDVDEALAQANAFYSMMFDRDLWYYEDTYVFTGYIFSCDGDDSTKWKYDKYENVKVSKDIIDTYFARNADTSYWSASAQSTSGKYTVAGQRIAADSELAAFVAQYGYSSSNPPLICGSYTSSTDYSTNYTSCGHYDSSGTKIGFQWHDDNQNVIDDDTEANYAIYNPGKLRWGYTNSNCINKFTAARNTINLLVDKIAAADSNAQIAFIPFGYDNSHGAITETYSVNFTTDTSAIKSKVNTVTTQGATTYDTWIDKLDEFMSSHNQTRSDRMVKVILISDGMPTDSNEKSNTYSDLGVLARQIAGNGYYGGDYETALLQDVIPYTLYAMRKTAGGTVTVHGVTYSGKGYSNMVINTVGVGYTPNVTAQGADSGGFSATAQLMMDIADYTNGDYVFLAAVENGTAHLNTDSLALAIEEATESTPIYFDSKVLTDTVSDEYEIVSVTTEDGTASYSGNTVTWNVPTVEHYSDTCSNSLTIKVKLKDEYRYKTGDYCYVTNNDDVNGGCNMTYTVDGTSGSVSTATPHLKYGAVEVKGTKQAIAKRIQLVNGLCKGYKFISRHFCRRRCLGAVLWRLMHRCTLLSKGHKLAASSASVPALNSYPLHNPRYLQQRFAIRLE